MTRRLLAAFAFLPVISCFSIGKLHFFRLPPSGAPSGAALEGGSATTIELTMVNQCGRTNPKME
jgi:hypothetical protein